MILWQLIKVVGRLFKVKSILQTSYNGEDHLCLIISCIKNTYFGVPLILQIFKYNKAFKVHTCFLHIHLLLLHPAAQSDIGEQQWVTGFHCV